MLVGLYWSVGVSPGCSPISDIVRSVSGPALFFAGCKTGPRPHRRRRARRRAGRRAAHRLFRPADGGGGRSGGHYVDLARSDRASRHWIITQDTGPALHIPVNAEGADALSMSSQAFPVSAPVACFAATLHGARRQLCCGADQTLRNASRACIDTLRNSAQGCRIDTRGRAETRHVHSPVRRRADRTSRSAGAISADGCKPKEDWRIGTEHEKFGYCKDTLRPCPMRGALDPRRARRFARPHGWAPVIEGGNLIGLEKDGANISLEPGGQLELSGAPLETIHQTCDEVNDHLRDVKVHLPTRSVWASSASAPRRSGRMTRCRSCPRAATS